MIRWISIFAVGLSLVPSLSEASLPRHALSVADLHDAVQTLTHPSPRAPHPSSSGGQLTNLVYSKSGTPFVGRSIQRNAAGLKTREVISAGLEVEQPDTWQKHTSDKADRLTGLARRDEYILPERWRGYTPSYNREGQVTNVCEGYRSWSSENNLTWDAAGRLVEYTGLRQTNLWTDTPPMPSWGLSLAYDGLGARTMRTDELITRRVLVDRVGRLKVPLMETDSGNTAARYYIWAPGVGLLAQIEASGTIHYFHADENGSTLALTDSSGNVSDQFAYSPWGELIGRTGTTTTPFTFVGGGGVTWEGGALYRMGARYYDARLKRWLSADPAGMAGGANLYLYCNGNPLYWVDLLGLCGQAYDPGNCWESGSYLGDVGHFYQGYGDAAVGSIRGLGAMVFNPTETAMGMSSAALHPAQIWDAVSADYRARSQTMRGQGSIVGEVLILAGSVGAGWAESGTPLFRAVTDAELNSIKQTGQFSVLPGSSTPLPGVQGKWFYGSLEDAQTWAGQAAAVDGGPLTIIQTTVPRSISPSYSQPWVDGIKNPALFHDLGNLNAPIKILSGRIP